MQIALQPTPSTKRSHHCSLPESKIPKELSHPTFQWVLRSAYVKLLEEEKVKNGKIPCIRYDYVYPYYEPRVTNIHEVLRLYAKPNHFKSFLDYLFLRPGTNCVIYSKPIFKELTLAFEQGVVAAKCIIDWWIIPNLEETTATDKKSYSDQMHYYSRAGFENAIDQRLKDVKKKEKYRRLAEEFANMGSSKAMEHLVLKKKKSEDPIVQQECLGLLNTWIAKGFKRAISMYYEAPTLGYYGLNPNDPEAHKRVLISLQERANKGCKESIKHLTHFYKYSFLRKNITNTEIRTKGNQYLKKLAKTFQIARKIRLKYLQRDLTNDTLNNEKVINKIIIQAQKLADQGSDVGIDFLLCYKYCKKSEHSNLVEISEEGFTKAKQLADLGSVKATYYVLHASHLSPEERLKMATEYAENGNESGIESLLEQLKESQSKALFKTTVTYMKRHSPAAIKFFTKNFYLEIPSDDDSE